VIGSGRKESSAPARRDIESWLRRGRFGQGLVLAPELALECMNALALGGTRVVAPTTKPGVEDAIMDDQDASRRAARAAKVAKKPKLGERRSSR
jgi:hypothetical protein